MNRFYRLAIILPPQFGHLIVWTFFFGDNKNQSQRQKQNQFVDLIDADYYFHSQHANRFIANDMRFCFSLIHSHSFDSPFPIELSEIALNAIERVDISNRRLRMKEKMAKIQDFRFIFNCFFFAISIAIDGDFDLRTRQSQTRISIFDIVLCRTRFRNGKLYVVKFCRLSVDVR